ncbi:hypothetical protein A2975_00225 [Candidatus Woesebacteria bacterium RIFCSPLOWO2_01_FULL_44_14]|uniref:Uncharacterized protein n=1 Tax=Candidatus Woesebacteria bacterium RIFCSPLOWO2_01_FULL_44_14 TaxID=1802525 RepID=A0A1F8C1S1_9BACT|nr:MAG: hypothetical protein A2975_00225 [Candidatus Woesebacteria bacterium RIFCSPLOWO2_01_FULL_44_14]
MSPLLERDFEFPDYGLKFVRDGEAVAVDGAFKNHDSIAKKHGLGEESDKIGSLGRKWAVDDAGIIYEDSEGKIVVTGSSTTCAKRSSNTANARLDTLEIVAEITGKETTSKF